MTVKGTQSININFKYMSKNEEDRIFNVKLMGTSEIDDWKRFNFKLITSVKNLKADVRSIVEMQSNRYPYYLG